jgi:hypothetical protein
MGVREKRSADADPVAGAWMAPVEMPVQTYQWNLRGVVEDPGGDTELVPAGGVAVAVAAPPAPPSPPAPMPAPPVAAEVWAAPAPIPVTTVQRDEPRYGGITLACVVALGLPFGLTLAVEGNRWAHGSGANTTLVGLVTATILLGSCLLGLLSSEFGRQRSIVRGCAAAGLSVVMTAMLGLVIDTHPGKFGIDLGSGALVVLAGPVLAFVVASLVGSRR